MDDTAVSYVAPTNLTPEKQQALAAYVRTGMVSTAMQSVGLARQTWYDWRKADDAFDQAVAEATHHRKERLEAEAERRALSTSDTLLIFLLKAADPEKYSDRYRHELTGRDGGPVQHEDVTQARERVRHRLAHLMSAN